MAHVDQGNPGCSKKIERDILSLSAYSFHPRSLRINSQQSKTVSALISWCPSPAMILVAPPITYFNTATIRSCCISRLNEHSVQKKCGDENIDHLPCSKSGRDISPLNRHPSLNSTLVQQWPNVGMSSTLAQRWPNVGTRGPG